MMNSTTLSKDEVYYVTFFVKSWDNLGYFFCSVAAPESWKSIGTAAASTRHNETKSMRPDLRMESYLVKGWNTSRPSMCSSARGSHKRYILSHIHFTTFQVCTWKGAKDLGLLWFLQLNTSNNICDIPSYSLVNASCYKNQIKSSISWVEEAFLH